MCMLATLCEMFTPLLVIAVLALPWLHNFRLGRRAFGYLIFINVFIGLAVTYSLMGVDHRIYVWPHFGLDYSTHSAFALAFCLPLIKYQHPAWASVLLAYGLVMNNLGYHSWADMLTTALAWAIFTLPLTYSAERCLLASRYARKSKV